VCAAALGHDAGHRGTTSAFEIKLRTALAADGIDLIEGVEVARVEPGPTLVLSDGRRVAGSHLLVAAGRVPNLDGLGLEAGGVTASARGIATDAGLRSVSNRRVFAAGDIADPGGDKPGGIGPRLFTHVGSYHAGIVVRRAIFRLPAKLDYAALPRVTFTDPELAQVGMTEAEARAAGHTDLRILRWPIRRLGRSGAYACMATATPAIFCGRRWTQLPGRGRILSIWTMPAAARPCRIFGCCSVATGTSKPASSARWWTATSSSATLTATSWR
jgi:pyruvate/2-oxoglutarate dehydrogenase complex dihydrolipoamide dehydrogenase (E3) component